MDNDTTSGAVGGNGSASPDGNQGSQPNNQVNHERVVPLNDHKRALDDMHKFKTHANELEAENAALKQDRLKENEKFKELSEIHKADAVKWKAEAEKNENLFRHTQKYNAVKKQALEQGMLPQALDDLDLLELDSVEVETTDKGRFAVRGAKEFVADLKNDKPHWFRAADGPVIDSGGGGAPPKEPQPKSAADVLQAERAMKAGKISFGEYQKVFEEYAANKQKG